MPCDVWIAGFPSTYGGADTELDHLIDLFRHHDVSVSLVPMFSATPDMLASVRARGCRIQRYAPGIFRDRVVVSFCNGEFLAKLPSIIEAGRPRRIIWFNCMTWLFDAEKTAHREGWIDYFGFVSNYQRDLLMRQLEPIRPVRSFDYRPFFNVDRVSWRYRPWDRTYRLGRISRDDAAKFAEDTWRIFDRVLVPGYLQKKVYILGYGANAAKRIGPAPPGLDWQTWSGDQIPASDFYRTVDTMVHKTGGSRESYCRVLIEAYAHGVVPIVERNYAFPELVVHGETGYMTNDSEEMSYYASRLAMDPGEHKRLAVNGRRHLRAIVDESSCWAPWREVLR